MPPVPAGLRIPHRRARRPAAGDRRHLGDRLVSHRGQLVPVSSLSESFSKTRMQFCLDIHHEAGFGQLPLQPFLLPAQRRNLRIPQIGPLATPQGGQRPGVAGPPSLPRCG